MARAAWSEKVEEKRESEAGLIPSEEGRAEMAAEKSAEVEHTVPISGLEAMSMPSNASGVPRIVLPYLRASTVFVLRPEPEKMGAITAKVLR